MSSRRGTAVPLIVLAGMIGLSACNSQPGHRRVALDMIESLELPAGQEQCMKDVIGGYTNDDLENIASDNEGLVFNTGDFVAAGTPEFQEYVERLQACRDGDREQTANAEVSGETTLAGEPSESTEEPGETAPPGEATQPAESTEA